MPHRLKQRQEKIQEKRKQTPWREFVMEIASWFPLVLYKHDNSLSRFAPDSLRIWSVVSCDDYAQWIEQYSIDIDSSQDVFSLLWHMLSNAVFAGTKVIWENQNSRYNDIILWAKNAYLNFVVLESENVLYSYAVNASNDVYASLQVLSSYVVAYSRAITNSTNIFYSSNIQDSQNIYFSANLIWCRECIWCNNLQNKSHCIQNTQYTPEEYHIKKSALLKNKKWYAVLQKNILWVEWSNQWDDLNWQFNRKSSKCENAYFNFQVHKWRNIMFGAGTGDATNVYDIFSFGGTVTDHNYACMWVWRESSHVYCCVEASPHIHNCYYSYLIDSCSYCFGCFGLKNKSYCIFNKQYSKEERYNKVDEIFIQMEADWTLWSFFPGSMCPFYFNDTAAYLIDDTFTKQEVEAQWYLWRDEAIKVDIPEGMEVVKSSELDQYEGWKSSPDSHESIDTHESENANSRLQQDERWIDPTILDKVIQDEEWNVYRIIKMEYDFLVKHWLPLPRQHWLDRLKMNFSIPNVWAY